MPTAAANVYANDWLPEPSQHPTGRGAPCRVCRTARRKRHHHSYRPHRPALREGGADHGDGCEGGEREARRLEHNSISARLIRFLTRTASDIALESEGYFPSFAICAQERRGKIGVALGQPLSIAAERRGDFLDRRCKRRLIDGNELAVAHDGTPADHHGFDRSSGLRKHDLPRCAIEWYESGFVKV